MATRSLVASMTTARPVASPPVAASTERSASRSPPSPRACMPPPTSSSCCCVSSTSAPAGTAASPRARTGCTGAPASPSGAAREKVRVAHALAALPRLSATMQRGAISYAKVRALTRVATPDNEAALLDLAQAGTAAHVERFARAWRRVDQVTAATQAESRHLHRHLSTWVDDDGMVVIRGRLTPEVGAVVQRALDAAADQLRRETPAVPQAGSLSEEVTPAQRRADALGLLAEAALSADLDRGSAGDRYQVVLACGRPDDCGGSGQFWGGGRRMVCRERSRSTTARSTFPRKRRSAFPATPSLVTMRHGADGAVLDVGRKTRTMPPSIRRALLARDRTADSRAAPPGAATRITCEHWIDGGATSLDNLVLLCRRHHRAVHEGGFELRQHRDGTTAFLRPNGTVLEAAPPPPLHLVTLDAQLACLSGHPGLGRHAVRCRLCDRRALQPQSAHRPGSLQLGITFGQWRQALLGQERVDAPFVISGSSSTTRA